MPKTEIVVDKEIKLGQPYSFSFIFIRKGDYRDCGRGYKQKWKYWHKKEVTTKHGIIIGKRTISNGVAEYDSDCGWSYEARDYINVYLVVYELNKKPVLVPINNEL